MITPQKKIPALRFPEFEEEWEEKKLSQVFKIQYGKDYKHLEQGEIPVFGTGGVMTYVNEYLYNKPSVLIGRKGTINKPQFVEKPFWTVDTLFYTEIKDEHIPFFVFLIVSSVNWMKYNEATGVPSLNTKGINSVKVKVPSLPEQQKIASFFSAIDTRISHFKRKKTILEQYKKGLMQRIFSQELRFKDDNGKDFPAWKEKKFGSVFSFLQTNSFSRSLLNYESGTTKNIHYGDIHTKFKSNFDITKEDVPFINEDVDLSKIPSECYCREGDLVIADASEDYKDVGKAIELINLDGKKLLAGLHTFIARNSKGEIALGFMGYLMQSRSVRLQVMRVATGISVLGISKGNLGKVIIQLPCIEEQKKIAAFLTAIDERISLVADQIEKTKTYKKGLLQQMFV